MSGLAHLKNIFALVNIINVFNYLGNGANELWVLQVYSFDETYDSM